MNYKLSILKEGFDSVTIEEIEKFQKKIGYKLPQDYKDFILLYNGCYTGYEVYKYERINYWDGDLEKKESYLSRFISINFTIGLFDDEENERPDRKYLNIAECSSGNPKIYLSLNKKTYGNIYYNDFPHEGYYYKIADNFTDFLKGFIYEPEDFPSDYDDLFWTTVP